MSFLPIMTSSPRSLKILTDHCDRTKRNFDLRFFFCLFFSQEDNENFQIYVRSPRTRKWRGKNEMEKRKKYMVFYFLPKLVMFASRLITLLALRRFLYSGSPFFRTMLYSEFGLHPLDIYVHYKRIYPLTSVHFFLVPSRSGKTGVNCIYFTFRCE